MIEFAIAPAAATKLQEVLDLTASPPQMLRVAIRGGGCAGFEYDFGIAQEVEPDDQRVEADGGVVVLIDPVSGAYLHGSTLDYVAEMFDARFVLRNPNAKSTCGCGHSFSG